MQETVNMQVRNQRPLQEAKDELAREYAVRARCFPRWITEGRVSATDAQDRLDRLASAMEFLNSAEAVA
jgi:hypothetical protein